MVPPPRRDSEPAQYGDAVTAPNELEALIARARDADWRVQRQPSGHRLLVSPDGATRVTAPTVPSDQEGLARFAAQLREGGLEVPGDESPDHRRGDPRLSDCADLPKLEGVASAAAPSTDQRRRTRDNAKAMADAPKLAALATTTRGRAVSDESEPNAEGAVRLYLSYLSDPGGMRDADAIERAEQALAAAEDPIDKLKATAALRRAKQVDGAAIEAAFTAHAKEWAEAEGITADDFLALGVPNHVLAAAGFSGSGRARSSSSRTGASRTRTTRSRLDYDGEVVPAVAALTGDWKLSDLADVLQRDTQSARNALKRLLDDKLVEEVGRDTSSKRPGRAPMLYRSVSPD